MDGLHLLFEGMSRDDVTDQFLADLMDVAEGHDASPTGISVVTDEPTR